MFEIKRRYDGNVLGDGVVCVVCGDGVDGVAGAVKNVHCYNLFKIVKYYVSFTIRFIKSLLFA